MMNVTIKYRTWLAGLFLSSMLSTGVATGYAIEGHVPAAYIMRLLEVISESICLAVPGLPIGSPGMDGPAYGDRKDPYDVLLIHVDGSTSVYQDYR